MGNDVKFSSKLSQFEVFHNQPHILQTLTASSSLTDNKTCYVLSVLQSFTEYFYVMQRKQDKLAQPSKFTTGNDSVPLIFANKFVSIFACNMFLT